MLAGNLDRRVRVERATETQSPIDGSVTLAWVLDREVWGQVEPLSGRELFEAQQWVAKVDTRITIRRPPIGTTVTPDEMTRLVYDGRTYDIKHVAELGRHDGLQILAEARAE
jgi:SPP1 family predicted phage head-tail adaptor